jgi:uncharacterized protein
MTILTGKIAAFEAIPFDEFKQNPYTVMCTTSLGGHLSWFESGGHRWHARPVSTTIPRRYRLLSNRE